MTQKHIPSHHNNPGAKLGWILGITGGLTGLMAGLYFGFMTS